jgi:hypothetical protein
MTEPIKWPFDASNGPEVRTPPQYFPVLSAVTPENPLAAGSQQPPLPTDVQSFTGGTGPFFIRGRP